MNAAVYMGRSAVSLEEVPTPQIGAGEILVRVEACGICHTDLKKIEYDLLPGPRIFGHETAGTVVAAGEGVRNYAVGDRVIAFHHIPCLDCFYCYRKLYAQCPVYKKVGITAGASTHRRRSQITAALPDSRTTPGSCPRSGR